MPDGAASIQAIDDTRPKNVRAAGPQDEAAILDILLAFNLDNGFGIPVSLDRVRAEIERGTRQRGRIIGVIDAPDGRLAATIGLNITQFWYTDQFHLAEDWLFVRPEYRALGYHRDLFGFARWCGAQMGRDGARPWLVTTGVSSRKRLPAKLRLWSRFGRQIGGFFILNGAA